MKRKQDRAGTCLGSGRPKRGLQFFSHICARVASSTSPRPKTTVRAVNASKMLTINTAAQSILCLQCAPRRGLLLVLSIIIVRITVMHVISEITMVNTWSKRSPGLRSNSFHSHTFSTARVEVEIGKDRLKAMFLRDTYLHKQNTMHYDVFLKLFSHMFRVHMAYRCFEHSWSHCPNGDRRAGLLNW